VGLTVTIEPSGRHRDTYTASVEVDDDARPPVRSRFQRPASDPLRAHPVDVGERLFDAVFAGGQRSWAQAVEAARRGPGGLRVAVRSEDRSVQALPWELLYDRVLVRNHLALVPGWSVVREVAQGPVPSHARAPADLEIAVAVAAGVTYDVGQDEEVLAHVWPGARRSRRALTREALAGTRPQIVHLVAPAVLRPDGRQYLSPSPSSAPLPGAGLLDLLTSSAHRPDLVVLASCDTDLVAAELAGTVPTVVGMRGQISDAGCVTFLRAFYSALGAGSTVESAVAAGRGRVERSQALGTDWASPVAYVAPGQRLVAPQPTHSGALPTTPPVPPPLSGPPGATEARRALEVAMSRQNLAALESRWSGIDVALWPDVVRQRRAALSAEITGSGERSR
jgi:hypothetical protein